MEFVDTSLSSVKKNAKLKVYVHGSSVLLARAFRLYVAEQGCGDLGTDNRKRNAAAGF